MATVLERPETPQRRRFDVDDYYRMAEAGILGPKDRVELIEGEIVEMAPVGSEHAGTTDLLTSVFARAVTDQQILMRIQGPLRLDSANEPQPDLMLLRPRADFYRASHPTAADVLLLVEVADSSLAYDRGPKLDLYARYGVPEVWIVDLVNRVVEVCRQPRPEGYAERQRLSEGPLAPPLVPSVTVDVAALLG